MKTVSSIDAALPYLPQELRVPLNSIPAEQRAEVQEIRLRIGRSCHITVHGKELVLTKSGALLPEPAAGIEITRALTDTVFQNLCAHSVHAVQHMLRQGFVTVAGGNRAGFAGTAVIRDGQIETIRAISGINIRIAAAREGAADDMLCRLRSMGITGGVLLAGPPASGKTTVLREAARVLGSRERVCLIDERGELAAVHNGIPQFPVGTMTDVLDGLPKAAGIAMAVRVLNPQTVICDELGSAAEADAVMQSMHAGVRFLASAHAGSLRTLSQRPQIARMIAAGVFECAVLLGTESRIGQITAVQRLSGGAP